MTRKSIDKSEIYPVFFLCAPEVDEPEYEVPDALLQRYAVAWDAWNKVQRELRDLLGASDD